MTDERVRPFGNATHFMLWMERNCCKCPKYSNDGSGCDIQDAIELGALFSGDIDIDIARRMGYYEAEFNLWQCGEFDDDSAEQTEND